MADRCAHRHAPLSAGRVSGESIECRYHGWRYAGDGQLLAVPALGPGAVPDCGLETMQVSEAQGFIWASRSQTNAAPPHFVHFGEAGWTSFVMASTFAASVEACLENFLDCPHATFVHRYWFRAPTAMPVAAVVRGRADGAEAEYFEEPRKRSLVWALLSPRKGGMRHVDRFIAPATSHVSYEFPSGLAYVITSHCTPLDDDETSVTTVISFNARWGRLVRLFFAPLARRILQQDIDMLRLQAENRGMPNGPPVVSTPADLLGPGIWAWRQAIKEGRVPAPMEDRHVTLYL
jgi:phenylpropionate dioxygenase-like ring-hydroxylating dioxygenase large terminal subunit